MSRPHAIATTLLGCAAALLLTAFLLVLPARAQVTLLEDAETSAQSSDPSGSVVYGGALFAAINTTAGHELFRYNPEDDRGELVANIEPGAV